MSNLITNVGVGMVVLSMMIGITLGILGLDWEEVCIFRCFDNRGASIMRV